ncbi:MAG: type II toxin-antitoxin system RelE/ParE family toxin [Verrucomicrobiota bacterium]
MRLIFRPQFWIDLEDGVVYLAERASPEIASRWHDEVMAQVKQVESRPDLGRLRRDLVPPGIRSVIIRRYPRYLLFYRWSEETVEVLRIKHGMMDLPTLFSG